MPFCRLDFGITFKISTDGRFTAGTDTGKKKRRINQVLSEWPSDVPKTNALCLDEKGVLELEPDDSD